MDYIDVIREARFLESNYEIEFRDALQIILESEKNETFREIRDSIDSLSGKFDEGEVLQIELDAMNLFLEKISKNL